MPYLKADAPPGTPDTETIESLMGKRNDVVNSQHRAVKTLQELTEDERKQTGLVTIGKRLIYIPGDPFGSYPPWGGNVAHPKDDRMFEVLPPVFDTLIKAEIVRSDQLSAVQQLLSKVHTTDVIKLAIEMDNNSQYSVVKDTVEETVVDFDLGSLSVRLMNAKDIDLRLRSPYNHTARAKASLGNGIRAFGEPEMSVRCQQYVMARLVSYGQAKSNERETYDSPNDEIDITKNALRKLRADAQEHFWLHMMPHERDLARIAATCYDAGLQTAVDAIKSAWDPKWNNSHWDVDFFYQYKQDRESAEKVWELGDKDVFIVTDRSNRVVFANLEKATQLMYGQGTADTLVRALDLWSYFTALPAPESCRHVVDQYIRRLHPELDPRKVPVVQLPHAKMAVAHYECWSRKGDPNGTIILRTRDASFNRSEDQDWSRMRFPKFAKAVFGKATSIARLLVRNLDPAIYSEGVDIFKNLPEGEKVETDQEDFASLFSLLVNGYTQRHRDISDIRGGLAALITLGSYTGANLCLPQLGVEVPYRPGACAVLREDKLEHLVDDYSPPRYGIVSTTHESCKRHVLGRYDLPEKAYTVDENPMLAPEDEITFPLQTPCIDPRADDHDDDEIEWTNKKLHGERAMDDNSE